MDISGVPKNKHQAVIVDLGLNFGTSACDAVYEPTNTNDSYTLKNL